MGELEIKAPPCPQCYEQHWGPTCYSMNPETRMIALRSAEGRLREVERERAVLKATITSLRSLSATEPVRPTDKED